MKKNLFLFLLLLILGFQSQSQGLNHQWLLGKNIALDSFTTYTKARLLIDTASVQVIGENRKMAFYETQANISNENGNLIAATNGCWIMNATGDTMQNGSGLNAGSFAQGYCSNTGGLPMSGAALMLPFPGDTDRIVLFHQVGNNVVHLNSMELMYTIIDKNLNNGLGGVILGQKNRKAYYDTLSWGITATRRHANGRDWWILANRDGTNIIVKLLFTNTGIQTILYQNLNFPLPFYGNAGQPCFSPDGSKYAYTSGRLGASAYHDVRLMSFDRCTGNLSRMDYIKKTGDDGFGLSFSSNSRFLYYSSFTKIYQLDTDAPNIAATDTTVAVYDGYCYPYSSTCTYFWLMYRAANGKIYVSSQNFVIDLNVIETPDSAGLASNVQQHSLRLPCYAPYGSVNHPNYYLGAVTGSVCDSLGVGIEQLQAHDFRFTVAPNPSNGNFRMLYLLPQNQSGLLEVFDVNGRRVYSMALPPWSSLQEVALPSELAGGVYSAVVSAGGQRGVKKIVLMR